MMNSILLNNGSYPCSPKLAELIGIIIGDGYLYQRMNTYTIGVVGSPLTDRKYFQRVKELIAIVWKKEVRIVERARGLCITFGSKQVFENLVFCFGLPYGKGKCEMVIIPELILSDWNLARHTIRGIVDTDGSVFTAKKPGLPNYPSIEITTSSKLLALQLRHVLLKQGFRVANIWSYKSKLSKRITYKVPLNGRVNLTLWLKEIGFSNPYKLARAEKIINGTAGI